MAADSVVAVAQGRKLAQSIAGSDFVSLPGVGHIPAIEATDRFGAELIGWLDRTQIRRN